MEQAKQYYLVSPLTYTGIDRPGFTYHSDDKLEIGQLVTVPLLRGTAAGVVIQETPKPEFATKPVKQVMDLPALPPHLVELAGWMSQYYYASPKTVWQTILPAGLTKKRRTHKQPVSSSFKPQVDQALTSDQAAVVKAIETGNHAAYLLQGVTGAGKTRVYLELAAQALAAGKSVIVLVPEIALTPQIVAQFRTAFGPRVIATHSKLTEAQRHAAWLETLESDQPRVVLGPRSGLFLPLKNPGLIIIDECHETSYKQEHHPRYETVITAGKLAGLAGAKLVLGSATPGLREVYLAESGKIGLVKLTERINRRGYHPPLIIDLRDKTQLRRSKLLSEPLLKVLDETLRQNRQSLLFINRRGSASSQLCSDCGWVANCPRCQLPLTFHADDMQLICHFCNYRQTPVAICPNCGSANLFYPGGGTKKVEAEVAKIFPSARLARLDKDSAKGNYVEELYTQLQSGEVDILIGTQMIAKGLDLPNLDTVGIVSADTLLYLPDFSAAERTYQLISQVSGRSGRGDRWGQVIIQTTTPDHPAIQSSLKDDFWAFTELELRQRQLLNYPPYTYLLKLECEQATQQEALLASQKLLAQLRQVPGLALVGPAPAFREQLRGKFHWQIIAKAKSRRPLLQAAALAGKDWSTDLDPINLL